MLLQAPELQISKWLNTDEPISLASIRGKVIMAVGFQMLCPGCVELCIPQAKLVYSTFSPKDVQVIGLHTVFEHHEGMREESLKAFLYEYKIHFPVGIPYYAEGSSIPKVMEEYKMQGTPTTILIDKQGKIRKNQFGHTPDLQLGAEIMSLIAKN